MLSPFLGFGDRNADCLTFIVTLFEQSVGDFDRLQANFRRKISHGFWIVTLVPRHRLTADFSFDQHALVFYGNSPKQMNPIDVFIFSPIIPSA